MNMKPSTLRPGLLVSLKTSVSGNVTYKRQDIERNRVTEDGEQKSKWETERTIRDAAELEAAQKVRNRASALIRGVCTWSTFGLLCPEASAEKLDAAIGEARVMADAFNARANITRVSVFVLSGRIASNDVEAVKAINSEVADILRQMERAVAGFNVEQIRANASRLKQMGNMLEPNSQERISAAIDAARATARELVKAGEAAVKEVDRATIQRIAEARTAFIDLDETAATIQAPEQQGRAIDLEPEQAPAEAEETPSFPDDTARTADGTPESDAVDQAAAEDNAAAAAEKAAEAEAEAAEAEQMIRRAPEPVRTFADLFDGE